MVRKMHWLGGKRLARRNVTIVDRYRIGEIPLRMRG